MFARLISWFTAPTRRRSTPDPTRFAPADARQRNFQADGRNRDLAAHRAKGAEDRD
ncbi:MAG: hypothetical protein AAFQ42_12700 [Pseudomonadota bacterium]